MVEVNEHRVIVHVYIFRCLTYLQAHVVIAWTKERSKACIANCNLVLVSLFGYVFACFLSPEKKRFLRSILGTKNRHLTLFFKVEHLTFQS